MLNEKKKMKVLKNCTLGKCDLVMQYQSFCYNRVIHLDQMSSHVESHPLSGILLK